MGASTIFANVEEYPTLDFFGHSLSGDATPNIGASNAKNGEIILSNKYDISTDKVYIQNPIVSDKVIIYGIDKPYQYTLVDLLGRTKQKGFLKENQPEIIFQKSLKSGMYILKLQNEYNACSGRLLVFN